MIDMNLSGLFFKIHITNLRLKIILIKVASIRLFLEILNINYE